MARSFIAGMVFFQLFAAGMLWAQPVPNSRQLAWQEAELGVVFHYDLHVFDGKKYSQRENRIAPVADYNIFHPKDLDTDQWIRAVRDMGAKFAILTATHETGFALYQSDVNPYCLKAVKWQDGKGDIVRDFVHSCRKYGIRPGIYLGIRWNSFFGVHNFRVEGEGEFRKNRQVYYNHMVEGMVKEICTRYGELFEIWFDGGADSPDRGAPDVLPIVKKYQPNCLFYHNAQLAEARWGGSETGTVGEPCWATFPFPSTDGKLYKEIVKDGYALLKHGDPDGKYWMPAMADAPLRGYNGRHEWFWEPGDEGHIYPLEDLLNMYYKSVGRNATLILGLVPGPDGLLPEPDAERLTAFGKEIERRFSNPLGRTSGSGSKLILGLAGSREVNTMVLQEEIARGEHIRGYVLQAKVNGRWTDVCSGQSVGHKCIRKFRPVMASQFRILFTEFVKKPDIKNFSLFFIE